MTPWHMRAAVAIIAGLALGTIPVAAPARGDSGPIQIAIRTTTDAYGLGAALAYAYEQQRQGIVDPRIYANDVRNPPSGCGEMTAVGLSDRSLTDAEVANPLMSCADLPVAVGGVALAYNLPGDYFTTRASDGSLLHPLRLTARVVSDIYLGTITRWNDAAIAALNPGAPLPDQPLEVLYDAEQGGARDIFGAWLARADPRWSATSWPDVGSPPNHPTLPSSGVVDRFLDQVPDTIGFIDYSFATHDRLQAAALQNASGAFVTPSTAAFAAAADSAPRDGMPGDFRKSFVGTPAPPAYSPSYFVFMVAKRPAGWGQSPISQALADFLAWAVSDSGQSAIAGLGYVPISCHVPATTRGTVPCALTAAARNIAVSLAPSLTPGSTGAIPTAPPPMAAMPTAPLCGNTAAVTTTATAIATATNTGLPVPAITPTLTITPAAPSATASVTPTTTMTEAGTSTPTPSTTIPSAPAGAITVTPTLSPAVTAQPCAAASPVLPSDTVTPTGPLTATATMTPAQALTLTLFVQISPHAVMVGKPLLVGVRTSPHTLVGVSLRLAPPPPHRGAPRTVWPLSQHGANGARLRSRHPTTLLTARGASDRRGLFTWRLRPQFKISRPTTALLTVTARTRYRWTTRVIRVLILPATRG